MFKHLKTLPLLLASLFMAVALLSCDGRSGSSGVPYDGSSVDGGPTTTVRTKVALAYTLARGPTGEVVQMAATEADYRSASVKLTLPDGRILVMSYDGAGEYSCKVENLPAGSAGFIAAEFGGVVVKNFFDGLTAQGGAMDTGLTNPDSTLAADALAAFAQALAPVDGGYSVAELLSSVQNATLDIDVAALRTQIEDGQVAGYELARQSYNSILVWDNIDLTTGAVANLIESDTEVDTLNQLIANGGIRPPMRSNLAVEAKLVVSAFLDEYMNTRTVDAISPYLADTDFLSAGDNKPQFMLSALDEWSTSPKYLNLQSAGLAGLSYAVTEAADFTGAASAMYLVAVSGTYDLTYVGPQTVTRAWDGTSTGFYVGKVGGEWLIFGDRMRMWFDYSVGYFNTSNSGMFTELSFELGNSGTFTPASVAASNADIFGASNPVGVTVDPLALTPRYHFTLEGAQDTTWSFYDIDSYVPTEVPYVGIDSKIVTITATYAGATPVEEHYRKVIRIKEPTTVITGFTQSPEGHISVSWRPPLIDQQLLRVEVRLVGHGLNYTLPASDRDITIPASALSNAGLSAGTNAALDVVYFTPTSELAARQLFTYQGSTVIPRTAPPTFAPAPGVYLAPQAVAITSATSGASIYYTTDGTSPTFAGTPYTGPVTVDQSMTLKAIAVAAGRQNSTISTGVYELNIPPVLTIITRTLPDGLLGVPYSRPVVAAGGDAPYTWALDSGAPPTGLTLDTGTGLLYGTPTAAGTFTFTVRVFEQNTNSVIKAYTVNITDAPVISTSTLPGGLVGTAFSQTIAASGGVPPYAWSVASGALPGGLTLNPATGEISGTPTVANTFTFTVRATGANTLYVEQPFSIIVTGPPTIATTTLPGGVMGSAYSQSVTATGGVTPYAWSVTAGALPDGLTLDGATGAITGTPTVANTFSFTVRATGANTLYAEQPLSIVITGPPTITTTTLPAGTVTIAYNQTVAATGGVTPYAWTLTAGALPDGLTLNPSTGAITGTPTVSSTFNFTVRATGANALFDEEPLSITISDAPVISITTLPDGLLGTAYNQTVAAAGGISPYTWSVTAGALPTGLTLNPASGAITGTPTVANTFTFTVRATGANTLYDEQALTIIVTGPPTIATTTLPAGSVTIAYSQTVAATGGTTPYAWSVTAGALPDGLTLDGASGAITGTPTVANTFTFTVRATGANTLFDEQALSITITGAPTVRTTTLPDGTVGTAYSQTVAATGGTTPYAWSVTAGVLPDGLTLSPTTGEITGTPSVANTFTFTVRATGANTLFDEQALSISIGAAPTAPTITTSTMPGGTVGTAYNQSVAATGGTTPYAWSVTAGALPDGLTLSPSTGEISGTPTAANTFTFTVRATGANTLFDEQALSIAIAAPTVADPTFNVPSGTVFTSLQQVALSHTGQTIWYSINGGTYTSSNSASLMFNLTETTTIEAYATRTGWNQSGVVSATYYKGSPFLGIERVNVGPAGEQDDFGGSDVSISADGRYVVFGSAGTNLIDGGISPSFRRIYVRDRVLGTTELVSVSTSGVPGNAMSYSPTISANGRYVLFVSNSSNLVAGDTNGFSDIFLRDIVSGTTTLVSATYSGAQSDNASNYPAISADGHYAVFSSTATNLVLGDTNGFEDVFLRDLDTNTTTRINLGSGSVQGNNNSSAPRISADGGIVAYYSLASNLVSGDTNAKSDIFVYDKSSGTTSRVSVASNGTQSDLDAYNDPFVSADGLWIAFSSAATNLVAGDTNARNDVFLHSLPSGTTTRVSMGMNGGQTGGGSERPSLSSDGRYVTFSSIAPNLTPETSGLYYQIFRHDTSTGATILLSMNSSNVEGNNLSNFSILSGDGGNTVFASVASNLVIGDTLGRTDLFITGPAYTPVSPSVTTSSLPSGLLGAAYSQSLAATGGLMPYTWSITTGTLPDGLSLDPATGAITGTPIEASTFNFTVRATALNALYGERALSITINDAPTITTSTLPSGDLGDAYSQNLTAAGGVPSYTWSMLTGTLPTGVTLSTGGVLSGTPSDEGDFTFTAQVTDTLSQTDVQTLTLSIVGAPTITTTSLPNAQNGAPYSTTIAATGGRTPYAWSLLSSAQDNTGATLVSNFPPGLSINATSGVLSGTPTATGTYSFWISCEGTNLWANAWWATLIVTAAPTAPTISTTALPDGTVGTSYNQSLAATGGVTPYTWSTTSGSLPDGLTLNPTTGAITGTPTTVSTFSFTVRATGANSLYSEQSLSITVTGPPTILTGATLPNGTNGLPYSQTIAATGGVTPYNWSVESGALPDGLSLNPTTGAITGTPTATSVFTFTVRCTGADFSFAERTFEISTGSPFLGMARVNVGPAGVQDNMGADYKAGISADGRYVVFISAATNLIVDGPVSYFYQIYLHDRLLGTNELISMSSGGVAGGADSSSPTVSADGRYVLFSSSATNLVANDTNGSQDVFLRDRVNGTTVLVSTDSSGVQGDGTSFYPALSADGRYAAFVSGSSNLVAGDNNVFFDIFLKDLVTNTTTRINLGPGAVQTDAMSTTPSISADGGVIAYLSDATNLVTGDTNGVRDAFVYSKATGTTTRVSVASDGTQGNGVSRAVVVSADGLWVAFTSEATNLVADDTSAINDVFLKNLASGVTTRVSVGANGVQLNSSSQDPAISGDGRYVTFSSNSYNATPEPTNNFQQIFRHDISSGETILLSMDNTYGAGNNSSFLSWVSSDGSNTVFTSNATNLVSGDTAGRMDVFVTGPDYTAPATTPTISTTALPDGTVGTSYNQSLAATGGVTPYAWSLDSGTLPDGLGLSAGGVISGTPTTPGAASFTVRCTGANSLYATQNLSINVIGPVTITTTSLPSGDLDDAYSRTLTAAGGAPSYTWSIATGTLPTGVTLSTGGVLSGTPADEGNFTFTARVTDSLSQTDAQTLTLTILGAPTITTTSLPNAQNGAPYSTTVAATGGRTPYAWSLLASAVDEGTGETLVSSFPPGLSINPTSGVFSGTPTAAGTYSFWISCEGTNLWANAWWATLTVIAGPAITNASLPQAVLNGSYSQGLTVAGGTSPYAFAVISGALPDGLTLNTGNGLISGTATALGDFNFTVRVTDNVAQSSSRALSIAVDERPVIGTVGLENGTVGLAYSQTLAASKGDLPYNWSISVGGLPDGIALTNASGLISGAPSTAGTTTFTVRCTSANGLYAERQMSITVDPAGTELPKINPPSGINFGGAGGVTVTVSHDAPGALLYVTTDGTEPSPTNFTFDGASPIEFTFYDTKTVKALATVVGSPNSGVASATYNALVTVGPTGTFFASEDASGTQGNMASGSPELSGDGRFVAFESLAGNLTGGTVIGGGFGLDSSSPQSEIYVKDRQTGTTTILSRNIYNAMANGDSSGASISFDGRYVAFWSLASDLVSDDTNFTADVFVRDTQTGELTRVSVAPDGTQGNGGSFHPAISGDGRYVAFQSAATNLVTGDTNGFTDIFVRDMWTGAVARASVASDGTQGDGQSLYPAINHDGSLVVFASDATTLISTDANGFTDIYLRDMKGGKTARLSRMVDGPEANGNSNYPSIDASGRRVAFESRASNLVASDTNSASDIFVSDTLWSSLDLISVGESRGRSDGDSYFARISADGNTVAFQSYARNLVPSATAGRCNVYVRDLFHLETGLTTLVTLGKDGMPADNGSFMPSLSSDGRYVAYQSDATNLIVGDANGVTDVFATDTFRTFADPDIRAEIARQTGKTEPFSPLDLYSITIINLGDSGGSNLMGLQYLPSLFELDLSLNGVTDFTPLVACGKLTTLNLEQNQITSLNPLIYFPNLAGLTYLNLNSNLIEDLSPLSGLIDMGTSYMPDLRIRSNKVTSIAPIRSITFDNLDISLNCIADTSGLTATTLTDIGQDGACPVAFADPILRAEVESILGVASGTPLFYGDVAAITDNIGGAAPVLNLSNLGITDLAGIEWLDGVQMVDLSGNPGAANIASLGGMKSLYDLKFGSSALTDLTPLTSAANLTRLSVPDNLINDMSPALTLTQLANFDFSNNYVITAAYLIAHPTLTTVNISDNCIMDTGELSMLQGRFGAGLTNTGQSGKCF